MLCYSYLRFSSTEQAKGDSIRRQIAARDKYLERKGWKLDASFVIPPDRGKSAFHGAHRTTGNLRFFLDACEDGRIKRGSSLIVENLDRLSREEASDALTLFSSILNHGITIVTLTPEQEFVPGQMDLGKWVVALAEMCRGHSESLIKSSRGKANWQKKRDGLKPGVAFSQRKPSWLDIEGGRFVVDKKKAAAIVKVFELAAGGFGIMSIAQRLNRQGIPPLGKSKKWHDSYVYKILTGRSVLGEYQPQRKENGKLVPVGDVVKDFFPAVVTPELYARAAVAIRQRRTCGGRTTSDVTNLFTGLIFSPDGDTYSLRERGAGFQYLCRSNARAGYIRGKSINVPYPAFEKACLTWLWELRLDHDADPTADLEVRKQDLEERIKEVEAGIKAGKKDRVGRLIQIMGEMEAELEDVEESLQAAAIPQMNQLKMTKCMIANLEHFQGDDLERCRRSLKSQIRALVEGMTLMVSGRIKSSCKEYAVNAKMRDGSIRIFSFTTNRAGLASLRGISAAGEQVMVPV